MGGLLFTTDGELSFSGQTFKSAAAIQKFFESQPAPTGGGSLHVISNLLYTVSGETATGGAYWETLTIVDGHPAVQTAGRYQDVLKKVNGRWKFAKRVVVTDLAAPPAKAAASAAAR